MLSEPKLKTHIMYGANLSYSQSRYYLELLSSGNLIHRLNDKKWVTTEKGDKFLKLYDEAETMFKHNALANPEIISR
jgi:predicted transcriptional regulator